MIFKHASSDPNTPLRSLCGWMVRRKHVTESL